MKYTVRAPDGTALVVKSSRKVKGGVVLAVEFGEHASVGVHLSADQAELLAGAILAIVIDRR